jgi:hypothetical protein
MRAVPLSPGVIHHHHHVGCEYFWSCPMVPYAQIPSLCLLQLYFQLIIIIVLLF